MVNTFARSGYDAMSADASHRYQEQLRMHAPKSEEVLMCDAYVLSTSTGGSTACSSIMCATQ